MPKHLRLASTAPVRVQILARELGARLRLARKRRRITQRELAARAGVAYGTVQAVEAGEVQTGLGAYLAIAWTLGLDRQVDPVFAVDPEGELLERSRLPQRVRSKKEPESDF